MTAIDVNALSLPELKQLQKTLDKTIAEFGDRKKSEALKALEETARGLGFSLSELAGMPSTRKRSPAVAKYRHPELAEVTWSGRGRKPRWFREALDVGKSPESLAV